MVPLADKALLIWTVVPLDGLSPPSQAFLLARSLVIFACLRFDQSWWCVTCLSGHGMLERRAHGAETKPSMFECTWKYGHVTLYIYTCGCLVDCLFFVCWIAKDNWSRNGLWHQSFCRGGEWAGVLVKECLCGWLRWVLDRQAYEDYRCIGFSLLWIGFGKRQTPRVKKVVPLEELIGCPIMLYNELGPPLSARSLPEEEYVRFFWKYSPLLERVNI